MLNNLNKKERTKVFGGGCGIKFYCLYYRRFKYIKNEK